jgi:hypothetical protein
MKQIVAFVLLAVVFLAVFSIPADAAIRDDVDVSLRLAYQCSINPSRCLYAEGMYLSVNTATPFARINVTIDGKEAIKGRPSFSRGMSNFEPSFDRRYRFNETLRFGAPGNYRVVVQLFDALGVRVDKIVHNLTVDKVDVGLRNISDNGDDTFSVRYYLIPLYEYPISGAIGVDIKRRCTA